MNDLGVPPMYGNPNIPSTDLPPFRPQISIPEVQPTRPPVLFLSSQLRLRRTRRAQVLVLGWQFLRPVDMAGWRLHCLGDFPELKLHVALNG